MNLIISVISIIIAYNLIIYARNNGKASMISFLFGMLSFAGYLIVNGFDTILYCLIAAIIVFMITSIAFKIVDKMTFLNNFFYFILFNIFISIMGFGVVALIYFIFLQ